MRDEPICSFSRDKYFVWVSLCRCTFSFAKIGMQTKPHKFLRRAWVDCDDDILFVKSSNRQTTDNGTYSFGLGRNGRMISSQPLGDALSSTYSQTSKTFWVSAFVEWQNNYPSTCEFCGHLPNQKKAVWAPQSSSERTQKVFKSEKLCEENMCTRIYFV